MLQEHKDRLKSVLVRMQAGEFPKGIEALKASKTENASGEGAFSYCCLGVLTEVYNETLSTSCWLGTLRNSSDTEEDWFQHQFKAPYPGFTDIVEEGSYLHPAVANYFGLDTLGTQLRYRDVKISKEFILERQSQYPLVYDLCRNFFDKFSSVSLTQVNDKTTMNLDEIMTMLLDYIEWLETNGKTTTATESSQAST